MYVRLEKYKTDSNYLHQKKSYMEDLLRRHLDASTSDLLTSATVQCVLDEMANDIETWAYESEVQALKTELNRLRNQIAQHAMSERLHWDEKQNVWEMD